MTTITRKVDFGRRGRRKRDDSEPAVGRTPPAGRIPRVSKLMALAIKFDGLIKDGTVRDMSELARLAHVTQPRMTQIMNLLHLAPDIQEELLYLRPVEAGKDLITERDVRPIVLLHNWKRQRAIWSNLALPNNIS